VEEGVAVVVAVAEGAAEREAVAEGPGTLGAGEGERAPVRLGGAVPKGEREAASLSVREGVAAALPPVAEGDQESERDCDDDALAPALAGGEPLPSIAEAEAAALPGGATVSVAEKDSEAVGCGELEGEREAASEALAEREGGGVAEAGGEGEALGEGDAEGEAGGEELAGGVAPALGLALPPAVAVHAPEGEPLLVGAAEGAGEGEAAGVAASLPVRVGVGGGELEADAVGECVARPVEGDALGEREARGEADAEADAEGHPEPEDDAEGKIVAWPEGDAPLDGVAEGEAPSLREANEAEPRTEPDVLGVVHEDADWEGEAEGETRALLGEAPAAGEALEAAVADAV